MKKILFLTAFFIATTTSAQWRNPDTTIRGVHVRFSCNEAIFPESWRESPVSAIASCIPVDEMARSRQAAAAGLAKYPLNILGTNLAAIYYLKNMKFFGVNYGGTNSNNMLYLTNNGNDKGYSMQYLEQSIHHEFSSILFRNFPQHMDTNAWKNANVDGFDYNDPEAGVGAIRNNQSSQELDSALSSKGFLTQYALSSLENDINTIAQNLFCPDPKFWAFVEQFPKIAAKTSLLIAFYHKLDPGFTETYFRHFGLKN